MRDPIGIISAIPQEEHAFTDIFHLLEKRERHGFVISHGTLDGQTVVQIQSGIGKVNAAMAATLLLAEFDCRALIMAGVAGSLDPAIGIGDIVIGTLLVQHDYGAMIDGRIKTYQAGVGPFPGMEGPIGFAPGVDLLQQLRSVVTDLDLPPLSAALGDRVPHIHFGPILSGDTFVNCATTRDRLSAEFGGLAIEMEGAAIAQVAAQFGKPLVVVRAVSDLAGAADSHLDFPAFVHEASVVMATVVERVVRVFG